MWVPVRYGSFAITTSPSSNAALPSFAMPPLDGVGEDADEERHPRRLGPQPAVGRDDAEPVVLHVVEERVVRRTDERSSHLAAPDDHRRCARSRRSTTSTVIRLLPSTRLPSRSTCAVQPGGTTVVAVHSSTITGPSIRWSRASTSRRRRGGYGPVRPEAHRAFRAGRRAPSPSTPATRRRDETDRADPGGDDLERRVGVTVAVELAVCGDEPLADPGEQRRASSSQAASTGTVTVYSWPEKRRSADARPARSHLVESVGSDMGGRSAAASSRSDPASSSAVLDRAPARASAPRPRGSRT